MASDKLKNYEKIKLTTKSIPVIYLTAALLSRYFWLQDGFLKVNILKYCGGGGIGKNVVDNN